MPVVEDAQTDRDADQDLVPEPQDQVEEEVHERYRASGAAVLQFHGHFDAAAHLLGGQTVVRERNRVDGEFMVDFAGFSTIPASRAFRVRWFRCRRRMCRLRRRRFFRRGGSACRHRMSTPRTAAHRR